MGLTRYSRNPRVQSVDEFHDFVHTHGPTLVNLCLSNVVFMRNHDPDLRRDMVEALKLLRKHLPNLREVSINIRRTKCCATCPGYIGTAPVYLCCKITMEDTEDAIGGAMSRCFKSGQLDRAAAELGISETSDAWNFGRYIKSGRP